MRWFLGCDSSLDSSRGGEDNEQWWDTVYWREKLFRDDDDQDDNNDDQDTDNDGDDFVHPKLSIHKEEAKDEESFDPIVQTPENSDDERNDDVSLGMNVGGEEGHDAKDDDEELCRDVNINLDGRDVQMTDVHTTQEFKDTHVTLTLVNPYGIDSLFELTPRVDVQASTTVALTAPTLSPPTIPTISQDPQAPTPPTTAPSIFLQNLPNFGSLFGFDHRLKTLEASFSEFVQTNQFAGAVSSILGIVERYIDQRMNEAVKVAVQIQSDRLQDEAQAKNEEFLNKLDENIQKIIKEQVKEHVKVQVSKILPKIEKTVNEKLEAKVRTRSTNLSKTSYAMAADLSEPELKKILIEKMESNKSIHRYNEQMNLYKALVDAYNLVDAYECDKIILDTCGDTFTLKRRRDDADKDEEPSTRSDRGESAPEEEPRQTTQDLKGPSHQEFETGAADDQPIAEASQHPEWFQQQKNLQLLIPLPLITNSRGRRVIPFDHFINNDLEYLRGGASSRKYTTFVTKTKAADYGHIKWIEDLVPRTMWSQEPVGYNKYALWGISHWGRKRHQFYGFAVNRESARDNVHKKHRHPTACERSSTRCQKLPKKLNLTNLDTYRSDLKRKEAYTAYSNPRGFIYQNKDKQNMLMQIDELYKFSDGTLNDVRTALDDRLKGIRMKYLPQAIWRKSDKERAAAMI
nr:hypothetical protein [Tanacetum cinerariifolium]